MEKTAYLVLENGRVFKGKSFGAEGDVTAEIVFTTGMTGYLETLTDQSYYGQIVVQTFPLIGNYGIIPSDFESPAPAIKGYIVKNWCQFPSNFRCEGDLDTFLKERNIVGLYDIDTRALTKIIRESGVMNGCITQDPEHVDREAIRKYVIRDAVKSVSTHETVATKSDEGRFKVALMDFGIKENIRRELLKRGCDVVCVPYDATAETILALKPDGVMLSNGPGDPAENVEIIENLKQLIQSDVPIFGICLGHQLLALANGCKTFKLKYGHRGANQPVKNLETGRVYMTSQNHGYAVDMDTIDERIAKPVYVNANDNTCEGIRYLTRPAFSVQFHPEASGGPKDTGFLFDVFLGMMEESKNAAE